MPGTEVETRKEKCGGNGYDGDGTFDESLPYPPSRGSGERWGERRGKAG